MLAGVATLVTAGSAFAQGGGPQGGGTPKGRPFRTLAAQVATLESQVADLRTQAAAIQQQASASLAAIASQLDRLSAQVADHSVSLEQLRAYDALQDRRIASLGGAVLALEAAMAGVQADVQVLSAHDGLMAQWIESLETQWRSAETRLAANEGDIGRLVEADRALQEYAAALRQQVEFARTSADRAQADVAGAHVRLAELDIQLQAKQNRIRTACPAGHAIRQVDHDGTVACEFDDAGGAGGGVLGTADTWTAAVALAPNSSTYAYAYCPSGYLSLGGGFSVPLNTQVFYSAPFLSYGWVIGVSSPFTTESSFNAVVRCARVAG